jgi:hypothetical protein
MKYMKNRILCFIFGFLLCISLLPAKALAANINDAAVFVKQQTSKECTLASNVMMLRRKAILDGNANWATITSDSLRKQAWSNGGMAFTYTHASIKVSSYGMSGDLGYKAGDVTMKKAFLIQELKKHPEGIVIYVHHTTNYKHAILLTDYDSATNTFYCSDPANSYNGKKIAAGRIELTSSLLPTYIKNSGINNKNITDKQDLVIGYIQQIWIVVGGTGKAATSPTKAKNLVITDSAYPPSNTNNNSQINAPDPPTNLKAEKASDNTAKISWGAGKDALSYEVQYHSLSANTWKKDSDYKSGTSYTTTGLGLYDSYTFRVRSVNSAGASGWAEVVYYKNATHTHEYDKNTGFCKICGADYPLSISTAKNGTYAAVNGGIPMLSRPYRTENTNSFLSNNETVTVTGSANNSANELWYKLSNGKWVYSPNLKKIDAVLPTVTIKYNANGGSGAPTSHSATKDKYGNVYFNLSTTKPTKNGATFLGWRFENDSAYDIDIPGQSIAFSTGNVTSNETLTYYAQWKTEIVNVPANYKPRLRGYGSFISKTIGFQVRWDYDITELGYTVTKEDGTVVYSTNYTYVSGPGEDEQREIAIKEEGIYYVRAYVMIDGEKYISSPLMVNLHAY